MPEKTFQELMDDLTTAYTQIDELSTAATNLAREINNRIKNAALTQGLKEVNTIYVELSNALKTAQAERDAANVLAAQYLDKWQKSCDKLELVIGIVSDDDLEP